MVTGNYEIRSEIRKLWKFKNSINIWRIRQNTNNINSHCIIVSGNSQIYLILIVSLVNLWHCTILYCCWWRPLLFIRGSLGTQWHLITSVWVRLPQGAMLMASTGKTLAVEWNIKPELCPLLFITKQELLDTAHISAMSSTYLQYFLCMQ